MGIIDKVRGGKPKQTTGDAVVTRLVQQDTVPWFRKPNLRSLYFLLVPAAIGIEITSGFDSQLINALQIVPTWIKCKRVRPGSDRRERPFPRTNLVSVDRFPQPTGFAERNHRRSLFSRCYSFVAFHPYGR